MNTIQNRRWIALQERVMIAIAEIDRLLARESDFRPDMKPLLESHGWVLTQSRCALLGIAENECFVTDAVLGGHNFDLAINIVDDISNRVSAVNKGFHDQTYDSMRTFFSPPKWIEDIQRIGEFSRGAMSPLSLGYLTDRFSRFRAELEVSAIKAVEYHLSELQSAQDAVTNKLFHLQALEDQLQRIAGSKEISEHARRFEAEADRHKSFFLGAVFTLIVFLCVFATLGYVLAKAWLSDGSIAVQEFAPASPIATVLIVIIFVLLKVIVAERHNWITCNHKVIALDSMENYVRTVKSDEVRNAVSLQIASTIFTLPQTGYSKLPIEVTSPLIRLSDQDGK